MSYKSKDTLNKSTVSDLANSKEQSKTSDKNAIH